MNRDNLFLCERKYQSACKPGFVRHRVLRLYVTAIHLGCPLLDTSSDQPGRSGLKTGLEVNFRAAPIRSCSRWGLPCRFCCQKRGGLLLHPFTLTNACIGGLLSVALSLRSPSPDVIRHRVSMEPGLSSTAAFRHLQQQPSGRLVHLNYGAKG